MALFLEKDTRLGVSGSYWKISNIRLFKSYTDTEHTQKHALLSCYINQEARLNQKAPVHNSLITLPVSMSIEVQTDIRPDVYAYIKTLSEFDDAQDV